MRYRPGLIGDYQSDAAIFRSNVQRFWFVVLIVVVVVALVLLVVGAWKAADVRIGDLHRGVPELRPDSRYNIDTNVITDRFSIGVDIISVIVETIPNGCVDHRIMTLIDAVAASHKIAKHDGGYEQQ